MLAVLGDKIRQLREEQGFTREVFCGDETELSVRQLARIESGQCLPSLERAVYIANRLNMKLSALTDEEYFELPRGYQNLKYQFLRIPTFDDVGKLSKREEQLEEIFENYYEILPESEKLIVDCLQSIVDVASSKEVMFGMGLLEEYFEQVKSKKSYRMNDLILINLYFNCLECQDKEELIDHSFHDNLLPVLLADEEKYSTEELFMVNRVLIGLYEYVLNKGNVADLETIIKKSKQITAQIQDLQRMPIVCLMEWKYYLFVKNKQQAEVFYQKALTFADMMEDDYLKENLTREWQKDTA